MINGNALARPESIREGRGPDKVGVKFKSHRPDPTFSVVAKIATYYLIPPRALTLLPSYMPYALHHFPGCAAGRVESHGKNTRIATAGLQGRPAMVCQLPGSLGGISPATA